MLRKAQKWLDGQVIYSDTCVQKMGEWNFGHEPPNIFDTETWTSGYDEDFYMQEGTLSY